MNKTAHLSCGVCVGLATICCLSKDSSTLNYIEQGTLILASSVGSLLPDIDTPTSSVGQKVKPVSKLVNIIFGHRGLLHTPLFTLALSLVLWLLQIKLSPAHPLAMAGCIGLIAGYISHLFLDFLTPMGIMLFFPFSRKFWHLFGFKGRFRDLITTIIFISISICLFLTLYKNLLPIFPTNEPFNFIKSV